MVPLNLEFIINAITGIANPIVKDKLQRSEIVIKLLKQFNLAPEHPPADFSGVYAYTLVEYGVGKPKPFLELFRHEQIKQAFRKAFDHNNPSILLSEIDVFLDAYALGDEIKSLGIDVKREIAAFYIVFSEIARRSRTPAEVLTNQAIASLHQKLATITDRLDRLPTLEGVRTELTRLEAQNYLALPPSITENQCRAIALAQQLRGWFETLGYRFEKYEVWERDYFEWIINIPVRRNRYDRILVRGIAGEAGFSDVMALSSSVEQQRTDEGWLVTARRISRAARDEVQKEENHHLGCYTFDELLTQDADFSGYLDWLEAEVKRRQIDRKYVPLACTKEEIDPITKHQIATSRYDEEDGWIDGYIDRWLDDPAKEHISILGEFGTGKTWFALHYAWVALQRYRDAQKRGTELPRLPLVIPLRDYAKAVSVESLFSEFFFRQYKIPLPHYDAFVQLNRMGKLLLIFDGFDEMAARVDRQEMINNFWELAKVVVPGAKVILTCRTEHFPEAKEGRALLSAELQASTANLTGETPQFEVLELEKFNSDQIRQVLSFQASSTTVEQVMGNPQLLDLARRPVMTELILEALPDIEAGLPVDISRVYLYAVRHKMERDIKAERTFTSLADKLYFLCELSWEMLSTNQMSLNYRLFPDRIRRLFGSIVQEEKDLDHWHYDMMGQTMLIRDADGDYTPAHRSLLEFFVAYKFAAELGALAEDFTELARSQSCLDNSAIPVDRTWSNYFASRNAIAPLRGFISEPLEKLRETVGRSLLTKAVIDLLVPMLDNPESIFNVIKATRTKTEAEVGYVGGNAATLLVKLDQGALENQDLNSTIVIGADFTQANLRRVNFTNANLANCVFTNILDTISTVAFSPDGALLAIGENGGVVHLWEADSGRLLLTFKAHNYWVHAVVFCPKGNTFASCGDDETVKIWDTRTGECLQTLQGHTNFILSVAFSPDGKTLASGSKDQTVKLWDIRTGECLKTLQGHTNFILSVAFSPDDKTLASGSEDQTVKLWDINTGKCVKTLQGHTGSVRSITFSPDGNLIGSGSSDRSIKLWKVSYGECLKTLQGHTEWVRSVAFSPDGNLIGSCSSDQTLKLWDVSTGQCLKTLHGHMAWVRSIAFHPKGKTLISGGDDKTVRLWDITTAECLKTLQGNITWVNSVSFSSSGHTLASGSYDHKVRLWNVTTGECLKTLQGHDSFVISVAHNSNGTTLASGSSDKTVRLWDIRTGKCLKILQGHNDWINSVAFSPDNTILASASGDKTVRLWKVDTGECIVAIEKSLLQVFSIAFSPDGTIIASGNGEATIKLWDFRNDKYLRTLQGHTDSVYSVAFNPNGTIIASGSEDTTVRIWNIDTGKCVKTLQHNHRVRSVTFTASGNILISAGNDQTIKLWDVDSGECIKTLQGHTHAVTSVIFSPKERILASGSRDETIKFWNIESGVCLKTLRSERLCEGMKIKGITGLTQSEKSTLKALGAVEDE